MIISVHVGIALAFAAMLCWGFGDFFIQKSTRKIGDIEALFLLSGIGMLILLPFVAFRLPQILQVSAIQISILSIASIVILLAAILDFEALRVGKLSIVEPTWSFEIPAASLFAFFILGETIKMNQIVLIGILIVSLCLISFRGGKISKKTLLERGFVYALIGALVMGGANFFIGWGARVTDPIVVNFVTDLFMLSVTGLMLASRGRLKNTFKDFKENITIILPMSIADKAAWVAFSFSMVLAPIAVAVALSESYIIIAVIFGLVVNKEKLKKSQWIGLAFAVPAALILAAITK